jgi:hypothetical protein
MTAPASARPPRRARGCPTVWRPKSPAPSLRFGRSIRARHRAACEPRSTARRHLRPRRRRRRLQPEHDPFSDPRPRRGHGKAHRGRVQARRPRGGGAADAPACRLIHQQPRSGHGRRHRGVHPGAIAGARGTGARPKAIGPGPAADFHPASLERRDWLSDERRDADRRRSHRPARARGGSAVCPRAVSALQGEVLQLTTDQSRAPPPARAKFEAGGEAAASGKGRSGPIRADWDFEGQRTLTARGGEADRFPVPRRAAAFATPI